MTDYSEDEMRLRGTEYLAQGHTGFASFSLGGRTTAFRIRAEEEAHLGRHLGQVGLHELLQVQWQMAESPHAIVRVSGSSSNFKESLRVIAGPSQHSTCFFAASSPATDPLGPWV